MPGPKVSTNIADVYVFRRSVLPPMGASVQFLQLRRKFGATAGTWQPVMGHIELSETALDAALRELQEETGFHPAEDGATAGLAFWQLEMVNTYFLVESDCIMFSPCFAAEVPAGAEPILDAAHCGHRWIPMDTARSSRSTLHLARSAIRNQAHSPRPGATRFADCVAASN